MGKKKSAKTEVARGGVCDEDVGFGGSAVAGELVGVVKGTDGVKENSRRGVAGGGAVEADGAAALSSECDACEKNNGVSGGNARGGAPVQQSRMSKRSTESATAAVARVVVPPATADDRGNSIPGQENEGANCRQTVGPEDVPGLALEGTAVPEGEGARKSSRVGVRATQGASESALQRVVGRKSNAVSDTAAKATVKASSGVKETNKAVRGRT